MTRLRGQLNKTSSDTWVARARLAPLMPRVVVVLLGLGAILTLLGPPAFADPPGPTNYRTLVTEVRPEASGVEVRVLGGDSYLQIDARGVDVLLRGYDLQELYLRWLDDGTVEVNVNSVTYQQNQSRYGLDGPGAIRKLGPGVPPDWEVVSTTGSYAWHDHRIHWMSPASVPPNVDPSLGVPQLAYEWPEPITLEVDGQVVEVSGELRWFPDRSPAGPLVMSAAVLAVLVAIGRRHRATTMRAGIAIGIIAAGAVGVAENVGLAPGVQPQILSVILPATALVVALTSLALLDRPETGNVLLGLAGVPVIVWFLTHLSALTRPVLPVGPEPLVRVAVALSLGVGVGMVVLAGQHVFTQPVLDVKATSVASSEGHADKA